MTSRWSTWPRAAAVRSRRRSGSGTGSSGPGPRTAGASRTSPAASCRRRGKGDRGAIVIVPVDGGPARTLQGEGVPSFDPGDGELAPVFDAKGENLYAVGDGAIWRVDAASGKGQAVAKIPGWKIRCVVQPYGRATLLSPDGRTVFVLAREADPTPGTAGPTSYWRDGGKAGFFAVDLTTGKARPLLAENKSIRATFNLDANPKAARSCSRRPISNTCTTCGCWTRRPAGRARSRT